ncbi:Nucleotidylyl transferase [Pleomassaria siparia CBS 279.74]|uniref:Nucleotidylyl transferase n=1 Tax=Pleomassaria siparia CBS 279.74 TaxID=1314801 RepID=A0A6G1KA66_9PLEO|nr:Nucleotidylyl transferase [Pleomassaria siparia CBS 279.74]
MASRLAPLKALLPELENTLQSFASSPSKFRIVRTVNPTLTAPKTLYILDSSFNPPSIAHLALATSALTHPAPSDIAPYRLLLLFSTHNADKTPDSANFAHRVALMTLFAEDLSHSLKTSEKAEISSTEATNISIDIGLTKEPYYNDKSVAISNTTPPPYPSDVTHIHLAGYDTFIRFCNPKYYPNHHPPLSALAPFFESGHKMRVTQRPYDENDASSKEFGTIEEQDMYLKRLRDGEREQGGFASRWGERIDMVEGAEGVGVSSTRVRTAASRKHWDTVESLCTEGVAGWVREMEVYNEHGKD